MATIKTTVSLMLNMMIRFAIRDDVPAITKIIQQSEIKWTEQLTDDCFKVHYQNWVLLSDDRVIGVLIVHGVAPVWEIIQVAVDQSYRRRGGATKLVHYLVAEAKKNNVAVIQLEVRVSNLAAIQLYHQLGFEQVGYRKQYYSDKEDACLFDLRLC